MSVRHRPDRPRRPWHVEWYEGGRAYPRSKSFRTKAEAVAHDAAMKKQSQVTRELDPKHKPTITMAEYIPHVLAYHEDVRQNGPKTIRTKREMFAGRILATFGTKRVRDIRKVHVRQWVTEMLTKPTKPYPKARRAARLKRGSIKQHAVALHTIFERAIDDELRYTNPVKGLTSTMALNGERLKTGAELLDDDEGVVKAFTKQQAARFISTAKDVLLPEWFRFIAVMFFTGCRAGARGLQASDVDFEHNEIHLKRQPGGPLKGRQARVVPMLAVLVPVMREADEAFKLRGESVRIATTNNQKRVHNAGPYLLFPDLQPDDRRSERRATSRCARAFKQVLRTAKLPSHFSPHSLRHTYAVRLIAYGVPVQHVSGVLGHRDITITHRNYGQWFKGSLTRERIEAAMGLPEIETPSFVPASVPSKMSVMVA